MLREHESRANQQRAEIEHAQAMIASHSAGTAEEVAAAQRQLQSTKEELEGYRQKRMAARTEMIGMAQVPICDVAISCH